MTADATASKSPFVRIPGGWRFALVVFLLLYEWFFPTIVGMGSSDANALFLPRVIAQLVYVLLLCFPLIFYRREYGLLHPLILPTLFSTLKVIGKFPVALIAPLQLPLFNFNVTSPSRAVSIQTLSHAALASTRLEFAAVNCLALVCYYAGYFALRRTKHAGPQFHQPRNIGLICFIATMGCVVVGAAFIQLHSGGLVQHIVSLRHGRHGALAGSGQFLQVARFAVLPALLWFAYRPRVGFNPFWLAAVVLGSLMAIVTTGSRSALIVPLAVLLFLWWRKAGRILIVPSVALALLATVVIGAFGAIRQDYKSQTIDTSVLNVGGFGKDITRARTEFANRNSNESDLAAFAGTRNGMLWGRSYVGSVAFFIPRRVWPSKPFNGGAFNQAVNFAGRSISGYSSGTTYGIPMGPVSEAYWNFSLPGVVLVFFLLGVFYRWLSGWVWRNANSPAALLTAAWVAINFSGTSLSFVNTIRDVAMLAALYYILGIWRPRGLTRGIETRSMPIATAEQLS